MCLGGIGGRRNRSGRRLARWEDRETRCGCAQRGAEGSSSNTWNADGSQREASTETLSTRVCLALLGIHYGTVPLRVARVPKCPGIFSSGQQGAGARGVSMLQPHRPLRQPSGTMLELEGRHLQYAIHPQSQKHAECVQCRPSHGVSKCHSGHSSIHGSVAQDPSLHRRFRAPHGEAEFASQFSIAFLAENARV